MADEPQRDAEGPQAETPHEAEVPPQVEVPPQAEVPHEAEAADAAPAAEAVPQAQGAEAPGGGEAAGAAAAGAAPEGAAPEGDRGGAAEEAGGGQPGQRTAEVAAEGEVEGEGAQPRASRRSSRKQGEDSGGREKPEAPGAHLEVDIVPEGVDPLGREQPEDPYAIGLEEEAAAADQEQGPAEEPQEDAQTIVSAAIDLAAGARYRATGKRKTAVARVILRPGAGAYTINGRALEQYFPRATLQRNICQPLEAVGYQERMDVFARLHGGGVSSQAGALRHGISRALLEADPNLRGELKRRGFLTRDARVKERKKAGLKKARKRPQFSKR